ncbi:hypothetical protein ARMSODRAFT_199686 [Armillaria solidipes]|uniref:Uncharacterized protein n=1 Tax=Armillaria solidipes TaxID=1076256 RepID=A0A2H3BDF7_9AGAR|nr:hypothetical protein ARMSODRAFT_199686 [Armillaria solidipes]
MSEVKIYLRPRPVSSVYGHASYLPFQWHPDFKYGPFFAGYGTIPSDATEEYTIHSPDLSTGIAAFHNELLPSLRAEVPEITRTLWSSLVELKRTKLRSISHFLLQSQSYINRLYQGDHTPFPLLSEMRTDPEWNKLFFSILARGDVELRDEVDVDTEVEIFVWAYMHYMVYYFGLTWLKFQRDLHYPENSISLDTYRAKALILPPISTRKDNTNNQPPSNEPGVLMRSETNDTVTPPFLLRRRNRPTALDDADLN